MKSWHMHEIGKFKTRHKHATYMVTLYLISWATRDVVSIIWIFARKLCNSICLSISLAT